MPYDEPDVQNWSMTRLVDEQNVYLDAIFFGSESGGVRTETVKTYMAIRSEIERRITKAMTVSQMYEKAAPMLPLKRPTPNGDIHVWRDNTGPKHLREETSHGDNG